MDYESTWPSCWFISGPAAHWQFSHAALKMGLSRRQKAFENLEMGMGVWRFSGGACFAWNYGVVLALLVSYTMIIDWTLQRAETSRTQKPESFQAHCHFLRHGRLCISRKLEVKLQSYSEKIFETQFWIDSQISSEISVKSKTLGENCWHRDSACGTLVRSNIYPVTNKPLFD
jgi:hypothetical protein